MPERPTGEIERILEAEKRLASRELIAEAWQEGLAAGIEPELLAEEMVHAVVAELAVAQGESGAARLAEKISKLADEGRLLTPLVLQ